MEIASVALVYFSPTGTTKTVLEGIAKGAGIESINHVPLTLPDKASTLINSFSDKLVIIGAPVYSGRLPADAVKRLQQCKAENTPAVLVVVYGNRAYEDALLELVNLSKELGFIPVSGSAFIGEHSYATKELPIAVNRPDPIDMEKAEDFGKAVIKKLTDIQNVDDIPSLSVPGNIPYKEKMTFPASAPNTLEDLCTMCGICADVCPKEAITVNDTVETDENLCIRCCACVKECPENARIMDDERIMGVTKWLWENCSQRKEPEVFV